MFQSSFRGGGEIKCVQVVRGDSLAKILEGASEVRLSAITKQY